VALGLSPAARGSVASSPPPGWAASAHGLDQDGLERVFEAISRNVNGCGDAKTTEFLARLSLLLAEKVGDAQTVLDCIVSARETA
jgi:Protein of unknown function (DUF2783)